MVVGWRRGRGGLEWRRREVVRWMLRCVQARGVYSAVVRGELWEAAFVVRAGLRSG